jgi:hypothetical protein
MEMNVRIKNESNKSCVNFHMMCCVFGLLIAKQIKNVYVEEKYPILISHGPYAEFFYFFHGHIQFICVSK